VLDDKIVSQSYKKITQNFATNSVTEREAEGRIAPWQDKCKVNTRPPLSLYFYFSVLLVSASCFFVFRSFFSGDL